MRDLSLTGKSLVIVSCMAVPMVWLSCSWVLGFYGDWVQAHQASSSLLKFESIRAHSFLIQV